MFQAGSVACASLCVRRKRVIHIHSGSKMRVILGKSRLKLEPEDRYSAVVGSAAVSGAVVSRFPWDWGNGVSCSGSLAGKLAFCRFAEASRRIAPHQHHTLPETHQFSLLSPATAPCRRTRMGALEEMFDWDDDALGDRCLDLQDKVRARQKTSDGFLLDAPPHGLLLLL